MDINILAHALTLTNSDIERKNNEIFLEKVTFKNNLNHLGKVPRKFRSFTFKYILQYTVRI
jgi:hypothetical protein